MKKILLFAVLVMCVLLVASCGSDTPEKESRKRRSGSSTTSTNTSSTTTSVVQSPIPPAALLTPAQLQEKWTQEKLCTIVPPAKIKKILGLDVEPSGEYLFVESLGARCTFTASSGDEVILEITTTSFQEARNIDAALNGSGQDVVVLGVPGVKKDNTAFGTIYELNVYGEQSNQWVVVAPNSEAALSVATELIKALK